MHQPTTMPPALRMDPVTEASSRAFTAPPAFEEVYSNHFNFVWRSLRRLGVPDAALDDASQDVFVVVHARLAEFEGRASVKTWLFSILRKVARDHRPTRAARATTEIQPELMPASDAETPHEHAERVEGAALLRRLLDTLDDDKREVFVLSEIEQMTIPEVAEALGVNLNTVYSRARSARREMEQALVRYRAQHGGRL